MYGPILAGSWRLPYISTAFSIYLYNLWRTKLLLLDTKKQVFDGWLILAMVMVLRALTGVPDPIGPSRTFTWEKKEGIWHQKKKIGNYPKVVKMYWWLDRTFWMPTGTSKEGLCPHEVRHNPSICSLKFIWLTSVL